LPKWIVEKQNSIWVSGPSTAMIFIILSYKRKNSLQDSVVSIELGSIFIHF